MPHVEGAATRAAKSRKFLRAEQEADRLRRQQDELELLDALIGIRRRRKPAPQLAPSTLLKRSHGQKR